MTGALDKLLGLGFCEFAREIGRRSQIHGENNTLHKEFFAELNNMLSGRKKTGRGQEAEFKVILGLSLLIACESEQRQDGRLTESFLRILDKIDTKSVRSRQLLYLILCELTYLDQFLRDPDIRQKLHGILIDRFKIFPDSPSFKDYDTGWRLSEMNERLVSGRSNAADKAEDLEIILVGSVKGGVGKTLISIALAHALLDRKDARIALLDMDSSGPTLQYNLDIPAVSQGLSTAPRSRDDPDAREWSYPTFAELIRPIENAPAQNVLLPVNDSNGKNQPRLRAVVLPDSPTVTGTTVAPKYFNPLESSKPILAIAELIKRRRDRGRNTPPFNFNYLIIDLGPGLFGTNGLLFSWLTSRYQTSLLLVSSPRAFDLATTLYESVWLSAPKYMQWKRPILQFLNMWPDKDKTVQTMLNEKTNDTLAKVLRPEPGISSTDYIMFWRLREYLYVEAVRMASGDITTEAGEQLGERYNIKPLCYDDQLRGLLHSPELGPLNLDGVKGVDGIVTTTWYKEFKSFVNHWLGQRSGSKK
jgi:MinD-like ATPase involved in chromosome partitioning or flagellar assembly